MKTILRDRNCYPDALCRMVSDKDSGTITIASIIAKHEAGEMWIAVGPPNEHKYKKYTFSNRNQVAK